MLPEDDRHALDDLATELVAKASALGCADMPTAERSIGAAAIMQQRKTPA